MGWARDHWPLVDGTMRMRGIDAEALDAGSWLNVIYAYLTEFGASAWVSPAEITEKVDQWLADAARVYDPTYVSEADIAGERAALAMAAAL
jgi:hypothetical protein